MKLHPETQLITLSPQGEGYAAFLEYGIIAVNPYKRGDPKHRDWLFGYTQAKSDRVNRDFNNRRRRNW